MSGGHFDHKQFHLESLIEDMDEVLTRLDLEPGQTEDPYDDESLQKYVEDIPQFKSEVEKAKYHLKMAHTMVQRIDWFLSGDDGWNCFTDRLKEDLLKIEKSNISYK